MSVEEKRERLRALREETPRRHRGRPSSASMPAAS